MSLSYVIFYFLFLISLPPRPAVEVDVGEPSKIYNLDRKLLKSVYLRLSASCFDVGEWRRDTSG